MSLSLCLCLFHVSRLSRQPKQIESYRLVKSPQFASAKRFDSCIFVFSFFTTKWRSRLMQPVIQTSCSTLMLSLPLALSLYIWLRWTGWSCIYATHFLCSFVVRLLFLLLFQMIWGSYVHVVWQKPKISLKFTVRNEITTIKYRLWFEYYCKCYVMMACEWIILVIISLLLLHVRS